jgi:hypothetical protein
MMEFIQDIETCDKHATPLQFSPRVSVSHNHKLLYRDGRQAVRHVEMSSRCLQMTVPSQRANMWY